MSFCRWFYRKQIESLICVVIICKGDVHAAWIMGGKWMNC